MEARLRAAGSSYSMIQPFIILTLCAVMTVLAVRLLLIPGIVRLCHALRLSTKTEGQIIGYATSVPELVVLVSSAVAGVFDAGFWNIASSNIINWILFLSAVLAFRQERDLFTLGFVDELAFGAVSVAMPLGLHRAGVDLSPLSAFGLIALFIIYKAIDRHLNRIQVWQHNLPAPEAGGGLMSGIMLMIGGTAIVIVGGRYLGSSAAVIIEKIGVAPWLVGWILGVITSIPEMTSFFEIYRLQKSKNTLHLLDDTQKALDALVASNMGNLGIILPLGVLIYTLVH
ncbi:MAG: hypothetical protein GF344_08355 [Chitinivibrionales bacterium]|nr:hypothetical protein [Chitinivibrionales bacterium]MBD3356888.1 hypothetical protein [Chitinivibrionales bacterium]